MITKVFSLLGATSYPIYVFHQPIARIISALGEKYVTMFAPFSGIAFVLFLVALALYVEKFVDIPIRRSLTKKFMGGKV